MKLLLTLPMMIIIFCGYSKKKIFGLLFAAHAALDVPSYFYGKFVLGYTSINLFDVISSIFFTVLLGATLILCAQINRNSIDV
jgi:hypothetical protein